MRACMHATASCDLLRGKHACAHALRVRRVGHCHMVDRVNRDQSGGAGSVHAPRDAREVTPTPAALSYTGCMGRPRRSWHGVEVILSRCMAKVGTEHRKSLPRLQ